MFDIGWQSNEAVELVAAPTTYTMQTSRAAPRRLLIQGINRLARLAAMPARELAWRVLVLFVLWNISLYAPLFCIIHCHLAPWIIARFVPADHYEYICAFGHDAPDSSVSLPPVSALPPVIYPAVLVAATLLALILQLIGYFVAPALARSCLSASPPTPPPRTN